MVCIYCSGRTQVTNSRPVKRANGVWRRRQCLQCSSIFSSLETIDLATALMVERTLDHLEPFSRTLLMTSIYDCCKHLNHPAVIADELTNTVITELLSTKKALVSPADITSVAASVLSRFDNAAGVQYQAFHK